MKRPLFGRCAVLAGSVAFAVALSWSPARAESPSSHAAEVSAATQQAAAWLGALDLGHYDEAWRGLATVMQAGTTQDEWSGDIRGPREQLGKPLGRGSGHLGRRKMIKRTREQVLDPFYGSRV